MPEGKVYVLDSNVFMEAARRYYAFDIAPPFWDGLIKFAKDRRILSIERVKDEILKGKDALAEWTKTKFSQWFMPTDNDEVLINYQKVIQWADSHKQFTQTAKDEFYDIKNADAWIAAFALTNGNIVVTHEVYSPEIKRRILLPNVCTAFKIEYLDTFEMLRKLGFRFG